MAVGQQSEVADALEAPENKKRRHSRCKLIANGQKCSIPPNANSRR
jgi:hypothetical protein